jgi:hypothetical protein
VEYKLATLHDYRRARGLCFRCGDKWSRDHRCPEQIPLHVLQETWEICHGDDSEYADPDAEPDIGADHQCCVTISVAATQCVLAPRTIQFRGELQGQSVLILLDSGISHSFVSASVASSLSGIQSSSQVVWVKVADGGRIRCNFQLSDAS